MNTDSDLLSGQTPKEKDEKKAVDLEEHIKNSYSAILTENHRDAIQHLVRAESNIFRELEFAKKEEGNPTPQHIRLYQNAVIIYQYLATFHQLYPFSFEAHVSLAPLFLSLSQGMEHG